MDILHLLDRLEELIGQGFGVPGTSKAIVDRQRLYELFDELRSAVPDSVQHAEEVLQQRDTLLDEAREAAKRMREEAEAIYHQRLDSHDLVRAAHVEAERILAEGHQQGAEAVARAEAEATERLNQVNDYTLQQLRKLEGSLTSQLSTIQTAMGQLTDPTRTPR